VPDKRKFYQWAGKRSGNQEEDEAAAGEEGPVLEALQSQQDVADRPPRRFYHWAGKRQAAHKRKFYQWAG